MNQSTSQTRQPDEVSGNPEAIHVMKFEYCGGDPKTSSRLECTIFLNASDDKSGSEGIIVHSKESSKKYISADYETFLALIDDALSQA
eukprot:403370930